MGNLSEKQLTILTIAITVVLSGAFGVLIYLDFETIDEEKAKIATAEENIRKAQVEIEETLPREKEVLYHRAVFEREAAILPDEEDINNFWRKIKEFKDVSGVQIDRIEGLEEAKQKKGKSSREQVRPVQIKLTFRANADQLLKFVNQFENFDRLVNVTNLVVRTSRGALGVFDGEVRHDVMMELSTFVYNRTGGELKRNEIQGRERHLQSDELVSRIQSHRVGAIERYDLKPSMNRRDPFVSVRRPPHTMGDDDGKTIEEAYKEQKDEVDRLALLVELALGDWEIEKELVKEGRWIFIEPHKKQLDQAVKSLELDIRKIRENNVITFPELVTELEVRVVTPFRRLQSERTTPDVPVRVSLREVRKHRDEMLAKFEERDYKAVLELYQKYKLYRDDREIPLEAKKIEDEIVGLERRARVVSEFEALDIKIGALIVGVERSVALINGRSVAQGDPIEPGSKIILFEVTPDGCTFLYDDVKIHRAARNRFTAGGPLAER